MAYTFPWNNKNYMGHHATEVDALAYIVAQGWDLTGAPQNGMWYFDLGVNKYKFYVEVGASWHTYAASSDLDAVIAGLKFKAAVAVVSTDNLDLQGAETIDGVALSEGDRVLAAGQTDPTENGIYIAHVGALADWDRASDFSTLYDVAGAEIWVAGGQVHAGTNWHCTNAIGAGVPGTDGLTFSRDPRRSSNAGTPNGVVYGARFDRCFDVTNGLMYEKWLDPPTVANYTLGWAVV